MAEALTELDVSLLDSPISPLDIGSGEFEFCVASRETSNSVNGRGHKALGLNKPKTRQPRKTGQFFVSLRQALRPVPPTRKMLAHPHFTDHNFLTSSSPPLSPLISPCPEASPVVLRHQELTLVTGAMGASVGVSQAPMRNLLRPEPKLDAFMRRVTISRSRFRLAPIKKSK